MTGSGPALALSESRPAAAAGQTAGDEDARRAALRRTAGQGTGTGGGHRGA